MRKQNKFIMTLNGSPDREEIVEKWLLKPHYSHCHKIYGTCWSDAIVERWPDVFEAKGIKQMEDICWDTRYTFIPPFKKSIPEFVTQKFWKMIHYGIVPFFHPQYDTHHLFDVPDFLLSSTTTRLSIV
jgi:hypothetical protein